MRANRLRRILLPPLLGVVAALAFPALVPGYSLLGSDLPIAHRGFVVLPASFADPTANNNASPNPNFPGATGATLAVWKAAVEWGSFRHGPGGAGDPTQGALGGDPGNTASVDNPLANFDFAFQGAVLAGVIQKFVAASPTSLGPGILAVTYPGYDWQIFFDDAQWTWDDGPGGGISGFDIQGVAAHELGHALGLGHSADGSATMYPAVLGNGVANRSIATDDGDGVEAIYGTADPAKPRITGVSGAAAPGSTITIAGSNFAASGNEVWFASGAGGTSPRVAGPFPSSGTSIALAVPSLAPVPVSGDLLVKIPGTAGSSLSNAWPIAIAPPAAPVLASVDPPSAPLAGVPAATITLTGSSLGPVTSVGVGGIPVSSGTFLSAADGQLSFFLPPGLPLGPATVTASSPGGTSNALTLSIAPANPPALLVPWLTGSNLTFPAMTYALPGSLVLLALSLSNAPSVLPGLVALDLGNGFTQLLVLPTLVADATQGLAAVSFLVPPGAAGTTVYLQSAALAPGAAPPLPVSNLASTFVLF